MFKKELDPSEFYLSPEGYIIYTEKYHLKRGYCCKNGCKHCPFGYNKKTGKFDKEKEK
jgi:2-iminoacetate synthase ThiH